MGFRTMLFMEYSHGFTKVALGKDSDMLKSRIKKGYTIWAIEYEWNLNLDPNGDIGFGPENTTKNQFRTLKHMTLGLGLEVLITN